MAIIDGLLLVIIYLSILWVKPYFRDKKVKQASLIHTTINVSVPIATVPWSEKWLLSDTYDTANQIIERIVVVLISLVTYNSLVISVIILITINIQTSFILVVVIASYIHVAIIKI